MDLFAHQKRVKAVSRRLVVLLVAATALASATICAAVTGLASALGDGLGAGFDRAPYLGVGAAAVFLSIVAAATWAESRRLGATGTGLAQRLGARPLDPVDPLHRRLRDVTEEVAVRAGVPMPALFVLDEPCVNALAVGERPAVAAVMVTLGALEQLDRGQLQGVVGHAIARILNGDAAMGLRLTSALFGLCSVRLAGRYLNARAFDRGTSPERPGLGLWQARLARTAGATFSLAGLPGMLAAHLVRAGIGRQGQFLADAIAMRITGDRDGLGSVLRRIAGGRIPAEHGRAVSIRPLLETPPARWQGQQHCEYRALVIDFMFVQPDGARASLGLTGLLAARICHLYGRPMPSWWRRAMARATVSDPPGAAATAPAVRGARFMSRPRQLPLLFGSLFANPFDRASRAGEESSASHSLEGATALRHPWCTMLAPVHCPGVPASDAGFGDRVPHDDFLVGASQPISADMQGWSETIAIPADDRTAAIPLSATPAAALVARLRASAISRDDASRWLCVLVSGAVWGASGPENDPRVAAALRWLLSPAGAPLRVPVLELVLARLLRWSSAHRREMLECCRCALERRGRVESAEWVHYTLARHRLLRGHEGTPGTWTTWRTPAAEGAASARLGLTRERRPGLGLGLGRGARRRVRRARQSRSLAALFAVAATIGEASARTTRDTLAQTAAMLGVEPPAATPDDLDPAELASALDNLVALPSLDKPILLRMLTRMARTPGDPGFEAFIRAVAAAIDCPMPRLSRPRASARLR